MRTMAIVSAMFITIMFLGVSLSSKDKPMVAVQGTVATVMPLSTVTLVRPTVMLPVATPTVHFYCDGRVPYCGTDECAAWCRETRFPTPDVNGTHLTLRGG